MEGNEIFFFFFMENNLNSNLLSIFFLFLIKSFNILLIRIWSW